MRACDPLARVLSVPCSLSIAAAALFAEPGSAQIQADGAEFAVNSYTTARQSSAAIASGAGGAADDFVVVWTSPLQDGSPSSVFGQRFSGAGAPAGTEFQLNAYTTGNQFAPSVAAAPGGGFLAVWSATSGGLSGTGGVIARRYDAAGVAVAGEIVVNEGSGRTPDVAAVGDAFVVAWTDAGDGQLDGIFARVVTAGGLPDGDAFLVNSYTTLLQSRAAVAPLGAGGFVVVWESFSQDGDGNGVFGQRFDGSAAPVGTEFQVNTYTSYSQSLPDVAGLADGSFLVVWSSDMQDGARRGVYARRYQVGGSPAGAEFQVNSYTTEDQSEPAVAVTTSGDVLVVWQDFSARDGDSTGVVGRRYLPGGAAAGSDFQINAYTTSSQYGPAVAPRGGNGFVVAWSSDAQDGSYAGIFGRRFFVADATTTSTTLPQRPCAQPITSGAVPVVSDCLFILRVAVLLDTCAPACICAPSGVLPVSTTDALVCLQKAVGQDVALSCPCQ